MFIHTMDYYTAIKNVIMPFEQHGWITFSEVSQKEKDKEIPHDTTYKWNIKYDTNELTYVTDSQTQGIDWWLLRQWKREGVGGWG